MHVPAETKLTVRPDAVQTATGDELTDNVPSPVVETVAVKVLPATAVVGRFVITGVDATGLATEKLCWNPVAALKLVEAATTACRVQVPPATNVTTLPVVVHTGPVNELTLVAPVSPAVTLKLAV